MAAIDTPLLIVGHGPGALVAAKLASGIGQSSVVVGHEPIEEGERVVLDDASVAFLEPDGVLGVLRPYAADQDPFAIAPGTFEAGLKHHCVVDMLVTVFDGLWVEDLALTGPRAGARLTDGRSNWAITADAYLDVSDYPTDLNAAIHRAAAFVNEHFGVTHG
ncbi:MAG: hypothetical protein O3C27_18295 [Actinomycetota bacterium]|nr:hypothetical protein [Actinomycetota bacterium]